jgi:hypothetical protein
MKAAAAALVLIVGAVVILVFANTLNSWVLGGLIGGLSALLISIPVSLFLFTILARRHDQGLQTLEPEEMAYADLDEHEYAEVYEADGYILPDEEELYNETRRRRSPGARALPAAGLSQASTQRSVNYTQGYRRPSQALPHDLRKGAPTRQLSPDPRQQKRSVHEVNAMRAKFQTAALRAARREAELQFDDVEIVPTHSPVPYKRVSPARTSQPLTDQPTRFRQEEPLRELPPQQEQTVGLYGSRRAVDTASSQQYGARRTPSSGEVNLSNKAPRTDSLRMREPRTDQLRDSFPQIDPVYPGPETAQFVRDSQLIEELRNPDMITGSLKNPIVRRAPYMYEDDSLREELAQHIERPIKRRSSLFFQNEDGEEES